MFFSPFEQFEIIQHCAYTSSYSWTLWNIFLIILMIGVMGTFNSTIISNESQYALQKVYQIINTGIINENQNSIIFNNIVYKKKTRSLFFYVAPLFIFVFVSNLIGVVPYTLTVTAQLIVCLTISFSYFFGFNLRQYKRQHLKFFNRFVPKNISVILVPYLTPIETLSYVFRGISLGIRLFANLTAGHILVKVILGFCWAFLVSKSLFLKGVGVFMTLAHSAIIFLEVVMCLLQTYVLCSLLTFYFKEAQAKFE